MRVILSAAVVLAASLHFSGPAQAQSLQSIGGPAEAPPSSFQGQQYVDSRGCVFMRAGLSGSTTWVPRIGRDRRPICNQMSAEQAKARLAAPETIVAPQTMVADVQPVAAPSNRAVGKPMATIASNIGKGGQMGVQTPTYVPGLTPATAAPRPSVASATVAIPAVIVPAQRGVVQANVAQAQAVARSNGCPAAAPALQRMALSGGGTVMVCTRGDGTATGWVSPNYATVGGALRNVPVQNVANGLVAPRQVVQASNSQLAPTAPDLTAPDLTAPAYVQTVLAGQQVVGSMGAKGTNYVPAWKDGRLNPLRGYGTATGWAAQGQVWTQRTPGKSLADLERQKARKAAIAQANIRVTESSRSQAGAAHYVQVGTYGNPNNVTNASGTLAAMGLPVAKTQSNKGGRAMVTVFAGPFANGADAQTALNMARRAGFGDAVLR